MMEQDTKHEEIQTVEPSGAPAPRRIASADAAYSIYSKLKDDDSTDALRRATIQGMIDGNAPYNQAELEEAGLGSMTNVNFMSMRANLDSRAGAAHELFMEVQTLIECVPRKSGQELRNELHLLGVIAEEFTFTVRTWQGFLVNMDLAFRESDAYGLGFALFQDEYTWRPKAYKRGNLLLDPEASVDVEQNDLYMVRDTMRAGELFDKIRDPVLAREEGWNPTAVELILKRVFLEKSAQGDPGEKYGRSIYESIQQMQRNCDPNFTTHQFDTIKIIHILSREVTPGRKVTHQILPEDASTKLFLYEAPERFNSMSEAMWWLPYNYGDGYVRSVRGVGSWMAQHDDLSNRYLCRVFDAGFMTSSLMLQPATALDMSRLQFMQHGPYTIVPPELKAIQTSFQPQLAPLIQLREVSEQVMKNNTGMYRQHPETFNDGAQKTARQVAEETAKEARLEKAAIAHRYNHYEMLYREMFRRLVMAATYEGGCEFDGLKEAKEFLKRCMERGVPREYISQYEKHFHIQVAQAIGLGSLGVRFDITNQLMENRGAFDAEGQVAATREWLAPRVGYRNVDKFRPAVSRDQLPSNEHSIAALENNDLMQGQQVVAGSDQLHMIHIAQHAPIVAQILQAVAEGNVQDPNQALQVLSAALPHIDDHNQYMLQDPKAYAQLLPQIKQLLAEGQAAAKTLQSVVVRMQRQQQRAQEEQEGRLAEADQVIKDRELEAKIYEINRKYEIERMKQESLNGMRAEKTAQQLQISRERTAADIQLKGERQAAELDIMRAKAQAGG